MQTLVSLLTNCLSIRIKFQFVVIDCLEILLGCCSTHSMAIPLIKVCNRHMACRLLSAQTLKTSSSVSSTSMAPLLTPEIFVLFLMVSFLHLSRVWRIINPPLARGETSEGSVFSHRVLPTFCWLYTRRRGDQSQRLSLGHLSAEFCLI